MDWDLPSPPESASIKKAHSAGSTVADFIATIFNKTGEDYLSIRLVGVSLGCEVAASAALRFQELSRRKINRITGLDPAYYLISNKGEPMKLSPESADFVDVVHTNLDETFGKSKQIGHVDFFVDHLEGIMASTCFKNFYKTIRTNKFSGVFLLIFQTGLSLFVVFPFDHPQQVINKLKQMCY